MPRNRSSCASSEAMRSQGLVEELSLDFLTRFISPYSGSKEQIHAFVSNCDNAYELASTTQKPILFQFIKSKISGRANLICSTRELDDWPTYKKFLLDNFNTQKPLSQSILELQSCQQHANESVMEYTRRVEKCTSDILIASYKPTSSNDYTEGRNSIIKELALASFLSGVRSEYRLILRTRRPTSFEKASEYALEEERVSNCENQTKFFRNIPARKCFSCGKTGHTSLNCYNNSIPLDKPPIYGNRNHIKGGKVFEINPDSSVVCKYCKRPGHSINECRQRERNHGKFQPQVGTSQNSGQSSHLNWRSTGTAAVPREVALTQAETSE
jgi:hypothetical protein